MRNLKLILLLLVSFGFGEIIYSQNQPNVCVLDEENNDCENGNGISTNPNNPINSQCTTLRNDFDWRIQFSNPEFYDVFGPDNILRTIQNPFTGPGDAEYDPYLTFGSNSNYQPEDGWELLKMNFGLHTGNVNIDNDPNFVPNTNATYSQPKLPYLMLYNKYTGVIRFFGSLLEPNSTYETVAIELRIPQKNDNIEQGITYHEHLKATNLLSTQGSSTQPLDQETDETSILVFVKYTNNHQNFFWFDLPVAYDPCICNHKVQLDVSFSFIQTASIEINGSIEDGIKTAQKPHPVSGQNVNYGLKVFQRVFAAGIATVVAIKTGGAVINFKAYVDLIDVIKDHPNTSSQTQQSLEEFKTFLSISTNSYDIGRNISSLKDNWDDMNSADKLLQYYKAQKVIDGSTKFFTQSKSSNINNIDLDNSSTGIVRNFIASGTFFREDFVTGTQIRLAMPGSNWAPESLKSLDYKESAVRFPAYSTYNERLGTFALLETPNLLFHTTDEFCIDENDCPACPNGKIFDVHGRRNYSFKLNPIKYTFNPKLNVDLEKTEIYGRIVLDKDFVFSLGSFSEKNDGCFIENIFSDRVNFIEDEQNDHEFYSFHSPFIPIENLVNMPIRFSRKHQHQFQEFMHLNPPLPEIITETVLHNIILEVFEENVFVQLKIYGKSLDKNSNNEQIEFFQIITFPINLIETENDPNGSNILQLIPSLMEFDTDKVLSEDKAFFGPVIISAKLSSNNNQPIKIYSQNGFILQPGAEISPTIELIDGFPFESTPNPPQTYEQISAFCNYNNGGKYKAHVHSAAAIAEEKAVYEERERARILEKMAQDRSFKFGLKPNPTSGMSTVFWDGDEMPNQLTLIDGTGQLLFETPLSGDGRSYDLDMSEYSHGVYFIIITAPSGKKGQQKLIKL